MPNPGDSLSNAAALSACWWMGLTALPPDTTDLAGLAAYDSGMPLTPYVGSGVNSLNMEGIYLLANDCQVGPVQKGATQQVAALALVDANPPQNLVLLLDLGASVRMQEGDGLYLTLFVLVGLP